MCGAIAIEVPVFYAPEKAHLLPNLQANLARKDVGYLCTKARAFTGSE